MAQLMEAMDIVRGGLWEGDVETVKILFGPGNWVDGGAIFRDRKDRGKSRFDSG